MSSQHRRNRLPLPELLVATLGVIAALAGTFFSIATIGIIGIFMLAISIVAIVVTIPLSFFPTKEQFIFLTLGGGLAAGGVWYSLYQQEETSIFSPGLVWLLGAGIIMSTLFTLATRGNTKKA